MKDKKCKVCASVFSPRNSMQRVCGVSCAIKDGQSQQKKAYKRETRKMKASIKTKAQWLKEAQAAFNKYIRLRDKAEPCISCGRHHQGQYHAGHYKTVGANPELRFNEDNCHKQCAPCNNHLSGNIANYRPRLVAKIGVDGVDIIEGPHEPAKYTIDEIKAIKSKYTALAKAINDM